MSGTFTFTRFEEENIGAAQFNTVMKALEECYETCVSGRLTPEEEDGLFDEFTAKQTREDPDGAEGGVRQDGFWALCDMNLMPGDARVDFAYRPTYLITAMMACLAAKNPRRHGTPEVLEALRRGLFAATLRGLTGHGYDGETGLLEAVEIYHRAGIYDFLLAFPDVCREFTGLWVSAVDKVARKEWRPDSWSISEEHVLLAAGLTRQIREERPNSMSLLRGGRGDGGLVYMAYGSNMDERVMEARCPGAVLLGPAVVEEMALAFRRSMSGYYATLDRREGARTPVVLWSISRKNLESLDNAEGFPECYTRTELPAWDGGEPRAALVYLLPESNPAGAPNEDYRDCLLGAYERFGFDRSVLQEALDGVL